MAHNHNNEQGAERQAGAGAPEHQGRVPLVGHRLALVRQHYVLPLPLLPVQPFAQASMNRGLQTWICKMS